MAGSGVAAPVLRLVGRPVAGHRRRNGQVGMRASAGMGALVVAGVIGLTAGGCSPSGEPAPPPPTSSRTPAPMPAVLTLSPAKDAKDVAPGEPVSVTVKDGQVGEVKLTGADGRSSPGSRGPTAPGGTPPSRSATTRPTR